MIEQQPPQTPETARKAVAGRDYLVYDAFTPAEDFFWAYAQVGFPSANKYNTGITQPAWIISCPANRARGGG